MTKLRGPTLGPTYGATDGANPVQPPSNWGAKYTPYTPSVAPALGGLGARSNKGALHCLPARPRDRQGKTNARFHKMKPFSARGGISIFTTQGQGTGGVAAFC